MVVRANGRWALFLGAAGLTLFAVAICGLQVLYHWDVLPLLNANWATQDRHHGQFVQDITYLEKSSEIRFSKIGHADAGPFLNSKFYWEPEPDKPFGLSKPYLSSTAEEKLLRYGSDWMIQSSKAKQFKVDLSFFAGLDGFDYWDIESHSPIAELQKAELFVPPPRLPIPEVSDLLGIVKLRLMMGTDEENPLIALQQVRQFSKLLMTTENLQLTLAGLSVLDEERKAYRYYVENLDFEAASWTPIDRNITRRMHRVILATRGYLRLWTKPSYLKEIFESEKLPPGFCAVANEAFPLEFSLRGVLEPHFPFEMNLSDQYKTLDRIYIRAEKACRLQYLSTLVNDGNFKTEMPGPLVINRFPYSRKVFGLRLSAAKFGGFDAYDQASLGQAPIN